MSAAQGWKALVGASVAMSSLMVWSTGPAHAAGSPDIEATKDMPSEALLGDEIPVTLTFANPLGPDGYNALIRDVLPAGVTYVPGSASPEPTNILPQGDGTTVLVWSNVADSLTGTSVDLSYRITTAYPAWDAGDTVTNNASVYVNSDPRILPRVTTPTGAVVPASFTGDDTASDSTLLVPFTITKSEPNAEDELLRGVHDHQTVYTLTIDNNFINPTNGFSVVDYVPAQLEFLGCGTADNTTTGEEYPGSGPIPNYTAALPNGACVVPSSVTTVDTDPDGPGPMPTGVYTRVEWNAAAIATARGSADLAASGTFSIDYVAAIPLRENTFPGPTLATSNLDNNTGELTTETESAAVNYAEATGLYNGTSTYTDSDTEQVVIEDVSIHKTADSATFVQDQSVEFTLLVESSEYAVSTGPITVTDTIPTALDFVGASPVPTSGPVLNADGTETYTWVLSGFTGPSATTSIVLDTQVREFYRTGAGGNGSPVGANDSLTNVTDLTTDATIITANDGSTTVVPVIDDSSASLSSGGPTILKEVSNQAVSLTCGDGTGVTFDPDFASGYRPGDRVCFRLSVDYPSRLDTLGPTIEDFLPNGFALDSWAFGSSNTIAPASVSFTAAPPVLRWTSTDVDRGGLRFEVVIQTIVTDPLAATPGDLKENLMKVRYSNTLGAVFQLRDAALAEWAEPEVRLDKGVMTLNATPVVGAPADGVSVREGDVVGYRVRVTNDNGTVDALDVSVRDVLPAGITCADVSAISNGGACIGANNWIQWDAADNIDVPAGNGSSSGFNLTYSVTVPVGVSAGASLVNTAGVRNFTGPTNSGTPFTYVPGNNIDPTLNPNTDPARDTSSIVTALPTINKTATTGFTGAGNNAANEATVGETISYTVTVGVRNDLTYYNASITDNLDAEKDLVAGTVTATFNGGPLPVGFSLNVNDATNRWNVAFPTPYTVPAGPDPQIVIMFDATVVDVASNTRGTSTSNRADFNFANIGGTNRNVNNSVTTRIVEPRIVLAKADDDPTGVVDAGQVVNYTVTATNDNGVARVSTAYDTVVVDVVPTKLTVLDAPGGAPVADGGTVGPNAGIWNAGARTITWTIPSIDPGVSVALTYQTTVADPLVAGSTIRNDADARTSSLPGTVAGERDATSPNGGLGTGYQATAFNELAVDEYTLAKTVSPTTATVGQTVTYTLNATVPGGVVGYDVTIIDELPIGVTFVGLTSVSCASCTPDINSAPVVPAGPYLSGADIAFFLGDLVAPSAVDRVVQIVYTGFVADVPAADTGATLTNRATLYWSDTDTITSPPTTIPDVSTFSSSNRPTANVATFEPRLTIDKDVAGQVADTDTRRARPGDVLTYSVGVRNTGTGPAHDVRVTDFPTDTTWAFVDTTADAGVTNTDDDPVGGLEWTIVGPIAPGAAVTITYTLTVPLGFDSSNEVPVGPEQTNVADVPSYFGVSAAERSANPTRSFRDYDNVALDTVTIELDLASIGDLVWFDVNGDGVRDPGEPGIANTTVTVTYLGPDGTVGGGDDEVFTTVTDASGLYVVEHLPGGNYTVDVDELDVDFIGGLTATYDLDGTTVSPNGFWTGALGENQDRRDVDFGYTGTGSIGDTIWFDQNRNGVKNAGEAGIRNVNVTVTWFGPNNAPGGGDDIVYTDTTDANGVYLIPNLPAGGYSVVVDTGDLPAGYVNVSDPQGDDNSQSTLILAAAQNNLIQDFGYAGLGSIGDTIYLNLNADGDQDAAEPGLPGVSVQLIHFGPDGVAGGGDDSTFTTTTGVGGSYLFPNLPPGNYQVTVTDGVTGLFNTDDPDLSGVGPDTGDSVSTTTLTSLAPNDLDQDFGYTAPSVQTPSIDVVKSALPTTVTAAGQVVAYSFLVTNNGNVPLTSVGVSDPLPGLSAVNCPVSSLPPLLSTTCTASYTVTLADMNAGSIANTATASGTPLGGGLPVTDTSSASVTATNSPGITVVKSSTEPPYTAVGQILDFTVVATNTGNVTLTNVTITDAFAVLGTCTPVMPATLAPGAALTCAVSHTVTQADLDKGSFDNVAAATGTTPQNGSVSDDSNLVTIPATQTPTVTLSKASTATTFNAIGQQIPYTITATNSGNVTLVNVVISDPNAVLGTCTPVAPATLAPGQTLTCNAVHTVTQADLTAGRILNTAQVVGISGVLNVSGRSNEVIIPAAPPAVIPRTGNNATHMLQMTGMLMVAGLLLLLVSKRRRHYLVLPPLR